MPQAFMCEPITVISLQELMPWLLLTHIQTTEDRFLLENLHALLLEDLYKSLAKHPQPIKRKKSSTGHADHKSLMLAIAGVIFFCSEGVDGFFVILETLSLQAICILIVGIVFSLISVVTLYAMDLITISKEFGIKARAVPAMLDLYIKEVQTIKAIRKHIAGNIIRQETLEKLQDDLIIIQSITTHYEVLDKARNTIIALNNNPTLRIAKYLSATVTGILFFSGGFFAGQTVAIDLAQLILGTVSATSWPIILASFVVGLAALCVYWFVERPDIENNVSRWFGLEQDKINTFCNETEVKEQKEKLLHVAHNLKVASERTTAVNLGDNKTQAEESQANYSPRLFKPHSNPNSHQPLAERSYSYLVS